MNEVSHAFALSSKGRTSILDADISIKDYTSIDFSERNKKLMNIDISDHSNCQRYIDTVLVQNRCFVAYGGYLEKRNLYRGNPDFEDNKSHRNIHLGMDFWAPTGTKVVTPVNGKVHSFKNNSNLGDYGPTIILDHKSKEYTFFTLYGHLSEQSLIGLHIGKPFKKDQVLATLGSPEINVGYAPHLHFQVILDMQDYFGDYPGVCAEKDLNFYSKNCPDPNLLLKIP